MLRRPTLLALLALLGATSHAVAADERTEGTAAAAAEACRGVVLEHFERNLPADTRRYAIGAHMAQPFATLWDRARRPPRSGTRPRSVAAMPDAVTVYAQGSQPLLIAYRTGNCVLAVLTLPRNQLWRLLRERLGQSV